jgi:ABC-type Na+ efflux pump permease subunit|tara:strand:+ start:463 stop:765 length:303 start_codon:yes stop_codon:yes gene_type:complete
MPYNLTGISQNGTTVINFVQGVNNNLMAGSLGILFLIGIIVIIFMSFQKSTGDVNKSMAACAFIAFGLALFMRALSLIPDLAMFITLVAAGVTIAFSWKN